MIFTCHVGGELKCILGFDPNWCIKILLDVFKFQTIIHKNYRYNNYVNRRRKSNDTEVSFKIKILNASPVTTFAVKYSKRREQASKIKP